MDEEQSKAAGGRRPRYGGDVRISEDEWVKDPKTGQMRLSEKGITRQKEDILDLAAKLGVEIVKWYPENDTTAFKKRRIRLPNGRSVWRVIRPEFREMLEDYEDGEIDGVIFYDIDRLARQPRDLEDLIDLVEYYKRPVETVTGNIDLRTSNGRAMARVLVAMANKSSEDTSRRVARARLQQAREGNGGRAKGGRRRFAYRADGSLVPREAELVRSAARRFLSGASWSSLVWYFEGSGIPPVYARHWTYTTVKQILLSPATAGIAVYNGAMRKENQEGRPRNPYSDPEGVALKDAAGKYIRGNWEPVLDEADWKAVVDEWKRRNEGKTFSASGSRKHLLTGLLRCGRIRVDDSMCNRSMVGAIRKNQSGTVTVNYRCPGKVAGGCGGTTRNGPRLDKLIEDLLFAHLQANAPEAASLTAADDDSPEARDLAEVQRRLLELRTGYAQGTTTDETFFATTPLLEARQRKLKADLAKKARTRTGRMARSRPVEEVRREWEAGNVAARRAILSRYLQAIVVRKSSVHGPGELDYSAIEPIWKGTGQSVPSAWDHTQ
jgi:site-specific DNA recombinase